MSTNLSRLCSIGLCLVGEGRGCCLLTAREGRRLSCCTEHAEQPFFEGRAACCAEHVATRSNALRFLYQPAP